MQTSGSGTSKYFAGQTYTEDSIRVQQINFTGNTGAGLQFPGAQGNNTWYSGPNGDYVEITLSGGIDFQEVGFNYGTGWHASLVNGLLYELLDNGVVVMSGSAGLSTGSPNYVGFSGGGFDTIRVRDNVLGNSSSLTDGASQALILDNIEMRAVPEPGSLTMLGFAFVVLVFRRRRTQ